MLAAVMLFLYICLVRLCGMQADLAESNLQANLIRISRFEYEKPAGIVLAGSSVGGRLLPSYFKDNGLDVQNLGLDGSCPLFAFEIIARRPVLPKILLVDTSTLFQPILPNSLVIRDAIHSPGWAISSWFIPFRPTYRPSSIVYSWFKRQKESHVAGIERAAFVAPQAVAPTPATSLAPAPNWKPEDQYIPVRTYLDVFRSKGVDVRLINIPHGEGWGMPAHDLERKMADDLRLPLLEIGPELAKRGVKLRFSDGLHLDVPSAKTIVSEYTKILK